MQASSGAMGMREIDDLPRAHFWDLIAACNDLERERAQRERRER